MWAAGCRSAAVRLSRSLQFALLSTDRCIGVLVSERCNEILQSEFVRLSDRLKQEHDAELDLVIVPEQPDDVDYLAYVSKNVMSDSELARIDCAFASTDVEANWGMMMCILGACERADRLRWLQISWVGTDFKFLEPLRDTFNAADKPFAITNAAGANAEPVATSAVAALLSLHRHLHTIIHAQTRHQWLNRSDLPPRDDLRTKTVLIFGLGAIGLHIAKFLNVFGVNIIGVKRSPATVDEMQWVDKMIPPQQLADAVGEADFVVVSSPLTAETEDVFDREMLARIKPTAFFLNVGRAAIVDEEALADALETKALQGAYLDVYSTEPLPKSSRFWRLPNVIVSPHDSQTCTGNERRAQAIFLENLELFAKQKFSEGGQALKNHAWPI
jgi:phosphoglycerate dehydrogenase-like enzyme